MFDPAFREIAKGRGTASFRLKIGHRSHHVVAWGTLATQVQERVRKGQILHIVGRSVERRTSVNTENGASVLMLTEVLLSEFKQIGVDERPRLPRLFKQYM